MSRFYCPEPLHAGTELQLPEGCAHHIHVLRLAAGDEIMLFNGTGSEGQYRARLTAVEKKRVLAEVLEFLPLARELPFAITVAQALPEASKMDWIVEKAVELGAAAIAPLAAQRCVVRLTGERLEKKLGHWERIIVAATEQCGRARPAQLQPLAELATLLGRLPESGSRALLLTPRASASLGQWAAANPAQPVTLLIGPEGGFTEQEEQAAIRAGALALGMGPRVLRTETAALAAIATLAALWDGAAAQPGANDG